MKAIVYVFTIAIISLSLIGCANPEREVRRLTNDYYGALVKENYEKAFETVYLYDVDDDNHPTDGTTLNEKEAKNLYMEKINILKENNYKITGFDITGFTYIDAAHAFAEVTIHGEVDGEGFVWHEMVDAWGGKAWIQNIEDPFGKYRDGTLNFELVQEAYEDGGI
ncbi:hypothetical protein J2T56_001470 [Natronobacillus azotifigens]|uniref:Uncharacterized protein n=1 Tax=Natronobacillus azotifigens TaxID=472978 RepID=A0A9J6RCX7_9BACI|nr:hypothetical protein [Natronobacillus azotifigens]MCZ0703206.1 hypothetical protein [Natronobacillus azotifigens]